MSDTLTGACLCGDIAFEFDGGVHEIGHCHCSMCRKFHGAAFATFVAADPANFRWTKGAQKARSYQSSDGGVRHFCPRCGSAVPGLPEGGPFALIPVGNIQGGPTAPAAQHFFVGSKAPWHEIADDLPQFQEFPPEFGASGVTRPDRKGRTPGAVGGSCLCGRVTYAFEGQPARMVNCHCSRCRRAVSGAYGTFVMVAHAQFRWLSGEAEVVNYKMPEAEFKGTAFCRTCGSQVPRRRDSEHMQIAAGSLDDDPGVRPSANIFVGSKAPWVEPDSRLPSFETYPPAAR